MKQPYRGAAQCLCLNPKTTAATRHMAAAALWIISYLIPVDLAQANPKAQTNSKSANPSQTSLTQPISLNQVQLTAQLNSAQTGLTTTMPAAAPHTASHAPNARSKEPEPQATSDSGIDGPPYQQIYQLLGELASRFPGWATVIDYGNTPGGRTMRLIRIEKSLPRDSGTKSPARPAVLISGSTHGNEYLHIEDRLPEWFLENRLKSQGLERFLIAGGVIYIVPIVNPDGYDRDVRTNNNNVDLNRDFEGPQNGQSVFREPETRLLAEYLDQDLWSNNLKLRLALDYHCCGSALLYPWSHTNQAMPAAALAAHAEIGRLMQEDIDAKYRHGATGQLLGYNPHGTSKDYYYAKYGALSFTFEGSERKEAEKFPQHAIWWDHVLNLVADSTADHL